LRGSPQPSNQLDELLQRVRLELRQGRHALVDAHWYAFSMGKVEDEINAKGLVGQATETPDLLAQQRRRT
jgi:hypothetical protein